MTDEADKDGPITIETDTATIDVITTEDLIDSNDIEQVDSEETNVPAEGEPLPKKKGVPPHKLVCSSTRVKLEVDEAQSEAVNNLLNIVSVLDANVILHAIAPKLFDQLSIWDIMIHKAQSAAQSNPKFGTIPLIVDDTERILLELKVLLESAMCFEPAKGFNRRRCKIKNTFVVNDLIGTALCVETGLWRRKETEKIKYAGVIDLNYLFPSTGYDLEELPPRPPSPQPASIPATVQKFEPVFYEPETQDDFDDEFVDDGAIDLEDDEDFDLAHELVPNTSGKRGRPRMYEPGNSSIKLEPEDLEDPEDHIIYEDVNERMDRAPAPYKKMRLKFKQDRKMFFCKFPNCPNSDVAFKNRGDFEAHFLEAHMTSEHRVIPCLMEDCGEKFALTSERNAHMASAHEKCFSCSICDRRFFREQDLEDHTRKSHSDGMRSDQAFDPSCVCTKCGKKFASRTYVDNHERGCDGLFVRQPRFTLSRIKNLYFCQEPHCDVNTPFESEYSLRMHFYDVHLREEEKIFVCEYCNMHFALRTLLNKHINAAHDKKHQCTFCSKRFGGRDKLKSHIFTHTGEKPYACDKCDYRTAKKYNLDQHKQSKHQEFGVKSHYCELCGKGFVTQGRLRQHKKIIHKEGRLMPRRRHGWFMDGTFIGDPLSLEQRQLTVLNDHDMSHHISEDDLRHTAAAVGDFGGEGVIVGGGAGSVVVPTSGGDGSLSKVGDGGVIVPVTSTQEYNLTAELADQPGVIVGLRY